MLILFLYMGELGYKDHEKAFLFVFRFSGVLFFSFPFGLWIKGKRLLPYMRLSAWFLPIITLLAVFAIQERLYWLIILSFILWGLMFSLSQITKLPFILRHSPAEQTTEVITLSYSTWSWGNVMGGSIIFLLSNIFPDFFTSRNCIIAISLLSYVSLYFLSKIDKNETVPEKIEKTLNLKQFDWKLIFHGMFPTFLIAIGAGMSIPFMNLYFEHTFGMDYDNYAALGFTTHCLVFLMILQSPAIKGKFGYRLAIPTTQFLAVFSLLMLGVIETFNTVPHIIYLAFFFFIIRQPLMNIAQPITTDIVMKYVGEKNQEIVSALMAMIWNGSFVISGLLFALLRQLDLSFIYIFAYTAIFYIIAIIWYIWLLKKIES